MKTTSRMPSSGCLTPPRLTVALPLLATAYAEQWILNARTYLTHILADLKNRNYQITATAIPDFERERLSLLRRLSLARLRKRQFCPNTEIAKVDARLNREADPRNQGTHIARLQVIQINTVAVNDSADVVSGPMDKEFAVSFLSNISANAVVNSITVNRLTDLPSFTDEPHRSVPCFPDNLEDFHIL